MMACLLWGAAASAQAPAAPPVGGSPVAPAPAGGGIETVDGARIPGRVVSEVPGRYAIVERPDGVREAVDWPRIKTIDGREPKPIPAVGPGSLVPENFTPEKIEKLAGSGRRASDTLRGLLAPKDGQKLIGSVKDAQSLVEAAGLKRGPPNTAAVGAAMLGLPMCFSMNHGNLNGPHALYFGPLCSYLIVPGSAVGLALAPFLGKPAPEMTGPSVHHLDLSAYALDYEKNLRSPARCTESLRAASSATTSATTLATRTSTLASGSWPTGTSRCSRRRSRERTFSRSRTSSSRSTRRSGSI